MRKKNVYSRKDRNKPSTAQNCNKGVPKGVTVKVKKEMKKRKEVIVAGTSE